MIRLLTGILTLTLSGSTLSAGLPVKSDASKTTLTKSNATQTEHLNGYVNGNGETNNRLPQLMRDVKVYLADAIVADVHYDTLEVIYNLDRIFELLTEADQFGEMTEDDLEEFARYESTLIHVYTNQLHTLEKTEVPFTAEQLRREVTEFMEPMEVEMGNSKFTVVDDRDGHIPLVINSNVEQYIKFFQNNGKAQYNIWLKRHAEYSDMVLSILKEYELPEELLYLAMIESGLNPKAYSRANASGMWQFVYSTGKMYGLKRTWYVDERRDPEKATRAACEYLKDLYEEFDNWYLALSAYNSGSGRVLRATRLHQTSDFWQLHSLPRETRNYIPYFLSAAIIGQNPEKYGFKVPESKPIEFDFVELEKSADLAVLAQSAGISFKTLQKYNPELRQSATPADELYVLKLPKGRKGTFAENFNAIPEGERFAPQYTVHRVKKGESLWTIAKKYRVSVHDLAAVNKIRNRHKIKIGQKLTIPLKGASIANQSGGPAGHYKVVYTVKKGDTLGHIAEDYKTRASQIRNWNRLNYGQYIYPGQKLTLWVKTG